jgi:phosphatidylglycerol lysyltransferase
VGVFEGGRTLIRQLREKTDKAGNLCAFYGVIPRDKVRAIRAELGGVCDRWLASGQGEEKAFALRCFDETYLANFGHSVLRHAETGRIIAFANLMQSGNRHGLAPDFMRRYPDGPKMAMDALFGELLL